MRPKCARPSCPNRATHGAKGYCDKHAYALGTLTPFVDATDTIHRLRWLLHDGHSYRSIARASGVQATTIYRLMTGQLHRVRQITADRIASLEGTPNRVPAWPLIRRVQSLIAAGMSQADISRATGLSKSEVCVLVHEKRKRVSHHTDAAIRELYAAREHQPVGTPGRMARERGWQPPLAWDDIDDPHEHPHRKHTSRRTSA